MFIEYFLTPWGQGRVVVKDSENSVSCFEAYPAVKSECRMMLPIIE